MYLLQSALNLTILRNRISTCKFSRDFWMQCSTRPWLHRGTQLKAVGERWKSALKVFSGRTAKTPAVSLSCKLVLGFVGTSSLHLTRNVALCQSVKHSSKLRQHQVSTVEPDKAKFDWNRFWWQLLWPDIGLFVAAIISALIVAAINIKIPLILGDIVNLISDAADGSKTNFFRSMQGAALQAALMYTLQAVFTFSYIAVLSFIGENVAFRFRTQLFDAILQQDIAFFDAHKTGEIINRLSTDIQDFKSAFKSCISQGIKNVAQTTGSVIAIYLISPKMTLLMLLTLPAIIGAGTAIGALLRKLSYAAHAQVEHAIAVADEAVGNIRTVRAFAMEDKEMYLFHEEVEQSATLNIKLGFGIGVFQGLSNMALNGIVLLVLCAGGEMMKSKEMSHGNLMSFMVATQTIQRSLAQLSLLLGHFVRGLSAGGRVFEFINHKPTMQLTGTNKICPSLLLGDVEFTDVSFSYPTRPGQVILKDFSLKIPRGHTIALCGVSGGGKSTVAALLERFYDVDCGSVCLDGQDIQTLDLSWLRGHVIGYISQEPVLFATSIMENIRYGHPDATDKQVKDAARMANAHDFIESFPDGYLTVLGERGITISGGQKQRIAIARAIIKDPTILILDEATSALDAESEKIVQETLDKIIKGRTVLVIAHRLSTIQNADMIAVLANGRIAEMGTHEELRRSRGLYWELIKHQESMDIMSEKFRGN